MDTSKSNDFPFRLFFIGLLLTVIFIYMSIPKNWEDATTTTGDGAISLADDWAHTIEKKKAQYANHDLYMLTAAQDGYFLCKYCPTGKFFLKFGEVYRYGTTGLGQEGRGFNEQWLNNNLLNYIHLLTADLTTVKTEETALIGSYVLLPENLSRPLISSEKAKPYWYRLVIPPGNKSLD